jgi:chemotaxis protein CheD
MTTTKIAPSNNDVSVGMGQGVFAKVPTRLTTILGSCVAVTLYSQKSQMGMLSHIVLPCSKGTMDKPAKYADTAIPYMLSTLKSQGIDSKGLAAKIVGGACMFGSGSFTQVGENNVQAIIQALETAGIPLIGQDVKGISGRRICFDLGTGCISVDSVGRPSLTI